MRTQANYMPESQISQRLGPAEWFKNTPLLPQRGKTGSVSGFAHTKGGCPSQKKGQSPFVYHARSALAGGYERQESETA